jgi:hypothetical protein
MALGSPDYRGPVLAHAPGTELNLFEWAPIILTPDELGRLLGRLGFELRHELQTSEGRQRFVAEARQWAAEEGLEPPGVHWHMAIAGLTGVALTCPLYANIPDGSWCGA